MKRRESIKRISSFLALATSFTSLAGILEGCSEKKIPIWAPLKLTEKQRILISVLADQIIPPTETPGATDAGVPAFIEVLLKDVFQLQDARKLLDELGCFNENCKTVSSHEFIECTSEQKINWLEAVVIDSHEDHKIFMLMKDLVIGAYFTSEIGMTPNLNYTPIPEKFEGCRSMDEQDKIMIGDRI